MAVLVTIVWFVVTIIADMAVKRQRATAAEGA